jgi:hypothetical protein
MDRGELGRFLFTGERWDPDHAARGGAQAEGASGVSDACATKLGHLGLERGQRTRPSSEKGTSLRSSVGRHGPLVSLSCAIELVDVWCTPGRSSHRKRSPQ